MGPRAPVAQLDRATGFEPVGRGFDSLRARQFVRPQVSLDTDISASDMVTATLSAVSIVSLTLAYPTLAQPTLAEQAPVARLADDFSYRIVDYGLGNAEVCAPASAGKERLPSRFSNVFWIRVRVTNVSEHLLRRPVHFNEISITD